MNRCLVAFSCALLTATFASAHHIWIIPTTPDGPKATAVFSDYLKPSNTDSIKKIVHTRLWVRQRDGNEELVEWTRKDSEFTLEVPGKGPRILGGDCSFGVETFDHRLQKHGEPYLLKYYPKSVLGGDAPAKPWDKLTLEIVPVITSDELRLQVFFKGKPAPKAEMRIQSLEQDRENLTTDANGEIKLSGRKAGVYGFQTRLIEKKAGEYSDKKYVEVRHHATLVLHWTPAAKAPRK